MNLQNDPQSLALMKFGIGQPVPRSEDPMLVRGEGCYTDDVKLAGEAHAVHEGEVEAAEAALLHFSPAECLALAEHGLGGFELDYTSR